MAAQNKFVHLQLHSRRFLQKSTNYFQECNIFPKSKVSSKMSKGSLLVVVRGRGTVGGDVKELLVIFINHVFVGVFQYDSATPKHALELKKGQIFFGFCSRELNFYGLEPKVREVEFTVLNSFQ